GALGHETLGGGLQAAKLAGVGIRLAAAARDEDEDHLPDLAGRHPAVHEEKALPETTGAGRLLPVAVEEKENRVANLPVLRRVVARRQDHRVIPLRAERGREVPQRARPREERGGVGGRVGQLRPAQRDPAEKEQEAVEDLAGRSYVVTVAQRDLRLRGRRIAVEVEHPLWQVLRAQEKGPEIVLGCRRSGKGTDSIVATGSGRALAQAFE